MGTKKLKLSAKHALGYQSANKDRRKDFHIKQKQARDTLKRQDRFQRKRDEDKNPELRKERLKQNVPHTIDAKRKWDEAIGENADSMLGLAVNLNQLHKRRKEEEAKALEEENNEVTDFDGFDDDESNADSMLEDDDEEIIDEDKEVEDEEEEAASTVGLDDLPQRNREHSLTASVTSTRLDITPEALLAKFPTLFDPPEFPKVLVTTGLNSTLHHQAELLTTLFPHSTYVRRSAHRFGHKYSVREISQFAANRNYTTVVILMEDQKKPCGLDVVHLPNGPMFHFSISNWVDGKKLPGKQL